MHVGTDEAGYGPLLGPLVIAAAVFRGGADRAGFRQDGIDDSKRIYTRGGRDALARALAPYLGPARPPLTLSGLLESCSVRPDPRPAYDWYGEIVDPVAVSGEKAHPGFRRLLLNPVCEREFNRGCRRYEGKGGLLFHETMRLVREALDGAPREEAEVVCDKHGGRNRYAGMLMAALGPASILAERESREASVYRLRIDGRPVRIRFERQADAHDPLAALASMAAKYTRELFMEGFNAYFAARIDGLRPTAGYYTDGKRFLDDIASLGVEPATLVRER